MSQITKTKCKAYTAIDICIGLTSTFESELNFKKDGKKEWNFRDSNWRGPRDEYKTMVKVKAGDGPFCTSLSDNGAISALAIMHFDLVLLPCDPYYSYG